MATEPALLVIDTDAELERLCSAQLQGPWQLPAELVRCALRLGAQAVRVKLGLRGLTLTAEGAVLSRAAAGALRAAVDPRRSPPERHRALVSVERAGLLPLLAIPTLGARGVLEAAVEDAVEVIFLDRRRHARRRQCATRRGLELRVRGLAYQRRRARAWLLKACRFAPRPVRVDGVDAGGAPGRCLAQGRITTPLPAWLAVPAAGDLPDLWLLEQGVVAARATVPGQPAFWAAVELGGIVPAGASAAALRRAVGPHLPAILHAAGGLLLGLGRKLDELPEAVADRVTGLLLEAAEVGLRRSEVESLPLLRLVTGGGNGPTWLSLARLRALGHGERRLRVVPRGAEGRALLGDGESGVVLAEAHHERIVSLTGLRLERAPEPAEGWTERGAEVMREAARVVVGGSWFPRVVGEDELTEAETMLLAVLQEALAGGEGPREVAMVAGRGRVRIEGSRLLVPRSSPDVMRAGAAVAAEPEACYAAAVLLLSGVTEPAARMRRGYVGRISGGG